MGAPGMACERTKGSSRQEASPGGRRRCRDASEAQAGAKDQVEHLVLRPSGRGGQFARRAIERPSSPGNQEKNS